MFDRSRYGMNCEPKEYFRALSRYEQGEGHAKLGWDHIQTNGENEKKGLNVQATLPRSWRANS